MITKLKFKEILTYEITSSYLVYFAFNSFLAKLIWEYLYWKTKRKYNRYITNK